MTPAPLLLVATLLVGGLPAQEASALGAGAAATRDRWRANAAAAPAWAYGDSGPTPQALGREPNQRPRIVGALEGEPLSCQLSVRRPRGWDAFKGRPDLTARVVVGHLDTAGMTIQGPNDSGAMAFTVPGVHLQPGDKIKLSAIDRDFAEHDWVGAVLVRYEGRVPIVFKHQLFKGACTPLDAGDEVVAATERTLARLVRVIAKARPSARDPAFGFVTDQARDARLAIEDLAARRGWAAREVVAAVASYDAAVAAFAERASKQVARLSRRPDKTAVPAGAALSVEAPRVSCADTGTEPRPCSLRMRFTAGQRTDVLDSGGRRRDQIARQSRVLMSDGQLLQLEGGSFLLDGASKERRRARVRRGDEGEGMWQFGSRGDAVPALVRVSLGRKRYAWLAIAPQQAPQTD